MVIKTLKLKQNNNLDQKFNSKQKFCKMGHIWLKWLSKNKAKNNKIKTAKKAILENC